MLVTEGLLKTQLEAVYQIYEYKSSYKFSETWLSEGDCECGCGSNNYKPLCPQGLVNR